MKASKIMEIIGPAFQLARLQRGFTMGEISKLTGGKVSASYIGKIERKEQDVSLRTLEILLESLNLSLFELIRPVTEANSLVKKKQMHSESKSLVKKLPFMKTKDIKILNNFAKLLIFWKSYSGARKIVSYYDRSLRFR